jgi:AraC-like DNA-binding protein
MAQFHRASTMSVSVTLVHALAESVEAAGFSRENLLKAAAIDAARLDDIDARLGHDEYDRLLVASLEMTGDEAFGLHMGERTGPARFGVLGQVVGHAGTMREAFAGLLRFVRLATDDDPESILEEQRDKATLFYGGPPASSRCGRARAEFAMVGYLRIIRHFAGQHRTVESAQFKHDAPGYRAEYTRIFGGSVHFRREFTGLVFDRRFLDFRMHPRQVEEFDAMKSLAERKLTRITRGAALGLRLREYLASRPLATHADLEAAARWSGISARSLRRKLEEENTSFSRVRTEARASSAKRMLEDPRRSIGEITYALGFSETSAFYRAFKRWTGMTPAVYRAKL